MRYHRLIAIVFMCLTPSVVVAQNATNPGGPWVTPNQNVQLKAFLSYEELTDRLVKAVGSAKVPASMESIAVTAAGRDVWLIKLGDPTKTPVLVITQQHGDEPHGTEAAIGTIKTLARGGAKSKEILDELFVLIVPRVNPDGAEFPDRGNGAFDAPRRNSRDCFDDDGNVDPTVLDRGRGVFTDTFVNDGTLRHYDINRYHWPDWSQSDQIVCNPGLVGTSRHFDPTTNPVPEAQAIVDTYRQYKPIWVVDVHNQGPSVVDEDERPDNGAFRPQRRVTGSILWPTNDDVDDAAVNLSKQMALVVKKRSIELGNMEFTRFNGGSFPGIARNAYGLLGTERINAGETGPVGGSLLVEILGQTEGSINFNLGQKAIGMLVKNAQESIGSLLDATADGSLFTQDLAEVDELILMNDPNITNPHGEE